jgi:ketosteroid isomerase-like protein
VLSYLGASPSTLDRYEVEVHDILGSNDHAVVLATTRAAHGGHSVESAYVQVLHIRDGRIVEVWIHY